MNDILNRISAFHLKQAFLAFTEESLGHVARQQRLERGYEILTQRSDYSITLTSNKPLTFKVKSPNKEYTIIESQHLCTCPDKEPICKHRFAVKLILSSIKAMKNEKYSIIRGKDNNTN